MFYLARIPPRTLSEGSLVPRHGASEGREMGKGGYVSTSPIATLPSITTTPSGYEPQTYTVQQQHQHKRSSKRKQVQLNEPVKRKKGNRYSNNVNVVVSMFGIPKDPMEEERIEKIKHIMEQDEYKDASEGTVHRNGSDSSMVLGREPGFKTAFAPHDTTHPSSHMGSVLNAASTVSKRDVYMVDTTANAPIKKRNAFSRGRGEGRLRFDDASPYGSSVKRSQSSHEVRRRHHHHAQMHERDTGIWLADERDAAFTHKMEEDSIKLALHIEQDYFDTAALQTGNLPGINQRPSTSMRAKSPYGRSTSPKARDRPSTTPLKSKFNAEVDKFAGLAAAGGDPSSENPVGDSSYHLHQNSLNRGTTAPEGFYRSQMNDGGVSTLPYSLQLQTKYIATEVVIARNEEAIVKKQLKKNMEEQWATLPLPFLFQRNAAEYATSKGIENIFKIFSRLHLRMEGSAFNQWKLFVFDLQNAEHRKKVEEYRKMKGANSLIALGKRLSHGKLYTFWLKWRKFYRSCLLEEMTWAAIRIQRAYRGRLGKLLAKMMRQKRKEEAEETALRLVQVLYFERQACRSRRRRAINKLLYNKQNEGAIKIQSALRARKARKEAKLRRIVMLAKREADLKRHKELEAAAIKVQSCWRRHHAQYAYYLKKQFAKQLAIEQENAAIQIQRFIRGFLGRCLFKREKEEWRRMNMAARRIQAAYRKRKGQFALHLKFQARKMRMEEDRAERLEQQKKQQKRLREAATLVQRTWRGHRDRKKFRLKKEARDRERADKARAARRIIFAYKKKKGQFALELRFQARKARLLWDKEAQEEAAKARAEAEKQEKDRAAQALKLAQLRQREREMEEQAAQRRALEVIAQQQREAYEKQLNAAALRVQCAWRRHHAQLSVHLKRQAIKYRKELELCSAKQIKRAWKAYRKRVQSRMEEEEKANAALMIQKIARGRADRKTFEQKKKAYQTQRGKELFSAKLIQRVWRGYRGRKQVKEFRGLQSVLKYSPRFPEAMKILEFQIAPLTLDDLVNMQPGDFSAADMAEILDTARRLEQMIREDQCATRIQARWRGRKGRLGYHLKLQAKRYDDNIMEEQAAAKLQRAWRGKVGRDHYKEIKDAHFKKMQQKKYLEEKKEKELREKWELKIRDEEAKRLALLSSQERELEEKIASEKRQIELAKEKDALEKVRKAQEREAAKAWDKVDSYDGTYYYNRETYESSWSPPPEWDEIEAVKARRKFDKAQLQFWMAVSDESTGDVYYYNTVTAVSQWEPPPLWGEDLSDDEGAAGDGGGGGGEGTGGAKSEGDAQKTKRKKRIKLVPKGVCDVCEKNKALRQCLQCDLDYCLNCFLEKHKSAKASAHTFTLLVEQDKILKCAECKVRNAIEFCRDCDLGYCLDDFKTTHSLEGEFRKHIHITLDKGSKSCMECEEKLATWICEQCDDSFCKSCKEKTHSRGKRKDHTWKEVENSAPVFLMEGEEYCSECMRRRATHICDQCGDPYCMPCFQAMHVLGKRKEHTTREWGQAGAGSGWEEFFDDQARRKVYFNSITKETTFDKPVELMWGKELDDYRNAEAEKKKAAEEVSELAILRKKAAELQAKVDKAEEAKSNGGFLKGMSNLLNSTPAKKEPKKGKKERSKDSATGVEEDEEKDDDLVDVTDKVDLGDRYDAYSRSKKVAPNALRKKSVTLTQSILQKPTEFLTNPFGFTRELNQKKKEKDKDYLRTLMVGDYRLNKMEAVIEAERKEEEGKNKILDDLAELRRKDREKISAEVKKEKEKDKIAEKQKDTAISWD